MPLCALQELTRFGYRPGSPGQDLFAGRASVGPSLYINGTPDTAFSSNSMLTTSVRDLTEGRFMTGRRNAPATLTGNMSSLKLWCKMSHRGPDPYNVKMGNSWVGTKHNKLAFPAMDGKGRAWMPPRPVCSRSFSTDPYRTLRKSTWVSRPGYVTQARY